ncbi:L domain-like protein [Piromyces finnis]|uniref:L domain-like protein n=1 Tax=Piromyces finnis TaxID=1754191 RepID=A0A1Y1V6V1_9FUNG|nr:L domain-like protein [Piromyces finnis]|eukprot:ORX48693.1 L domain-like protein [Piromyces finnis]
MKFNRNIKSLIQRLAVLYYVNTILKTVQSVNVQKTNCDYLKSIYKELDISTNWNDNTNDCCKLKGIQCNPDFNIIRIDLSKSKIKGKLSENIGFLTNLQFIKLDNNEIYGNIPQNIGELVNLEELILNKNNLSGTIPKTLGSLKKLKELNLGDNGLYDYIPDALGSLSSINKLYLENNLLEGSIPTSLSYLNNLEHM